MRDSYDHYFSGWNLDPSEPVEALEEFAVLVSAVGRFVASNSDAAEAWRVFPLDGKRECFFHFANLALAANSLPESTLPTIARLKAEFPRSFK